MKKEKWASQFSVIDEKYIEEADPAKEISCKRFSKKHFLLVAACICLRVVIIGFVLFFPFYEKVPDVSRYEGSEYYDVIQKLNVALAEKPESKNNFEKIYHFLKPVYDDLFKKGPRMDGIGMKSEGLDDTALNYHEITDNQVAGVKEGDRIKRSSKYLYYLYDTELAVYSINGENSEKVGSYSLINFAEKDKNSACIRSLYEMFLSEDCKTITLVSCFYGQIIPVTKVISLDVTDPASIRCLNRVTVTGLYCSSRVKDGKLLLRTHFEVARYGKNRFDFSNEDTFLPRIETKNGLYYIPPEKIISPDTLSDSSYTVLVMLDERTLEIDDAAAALSYSSDLYVSADTIYATRWFYEDEIKTEIMGISYLNDRFSFLGSIVVDGAVKDQYSMDAYEGVLRVVTTTRDRNRRKPSNANLYCINLSNWSIAAKVEHFAPDGEAVDSVRFDRHQAYVCTSIRLSDPVFFFDLSDLNHITYKDTGTISGFSSSLIQLPDGRLLGIGRGDSWYSFKIEIYEETDAGVQSVCKYEVQDVVYSQVYKSYYIDRERGLIGLALSSSYGKEEESSRYLLFQYNGSTLLKVSDESVPGILEFIRGVVIEEDLYMLGQDGLLVKKVFPSEK